MRAWHTDRVTIEAVVFDFDGLLMDTEGTMLASWQHEWQQHGLDLDLRTLLPDHGGDQTQERYAALARAAGPGYDHRASHTRRMAFRSDLNAKLGLLPGIAGWLDEAAAMHLRLAVASSSPGAWVSGLLTQARYLDRFEVLACGDDVTAGPKPDPAVYLLALRRLALPAQAVIAVEDAPHGVAAAHAAGLRCVAIPGALRDRASFGEANLVLGSAADASLSEALAALG